MWSAPRLAFARRRGALLGAGSSLPFPLRRGECCLTRRHGAGVTSARPHLCLRAKRSKDLRQIAIAHMRRTDQPQPALGKAIRELRQNREATLKEVASRAGVTFGTLALIERGEGNPTWATVRGITAALGISVSELARAAERLENRSSADS